jgi:hypothetical protein
LIDSEQTDIPPFDEIPVPLDTLRASLRRADWLAGHLARAPDNPFADALEGFPLTDENGMES